MYLLLGQTLQDHPDGLVRAEGYDTETLRLSIRPIFEELHVLKVGNTNIGDGVSNVLVSRPLEQVYAQLSQATLGYVKSLYMKHRQARTLHTSLVKKEN